MIRITIIGLAILSLVGCHVALRDASAQIGELIVKPSK